MAAQARMRVVQARTGMVLSPSGGALGQMLIPFRLGLGGVIGSGEQYMSWVTLDNVLGAIHHALITEAVRGLERLAECIECPSTAKRAVHKHDRRCD